MLPTTGSLIANKSISADGIHKVGGGKVIEKYSSTEFGTEFFTPRAKLVFAELRQVFISAPILYHFDPECHI